MHHRGPHRSKKARREILAAGLLFVFMSAWNGVTLTRIRLVQPPPKKKPVP